MFGDVTYKDDMHTFTVLLNVLINWYNSKIKEIDIEKLKVDFTINENLLEEENFINNELGYFY